MRVSRGAVDAVQCAGVQARSRLTDGRLRKSGGIASAAMGGLERPCEDRIEIPVPAIVGGLKGQATCDKCGHALSRTSAQTSARKISCHVSTDRCATADRCARAGFKTVQCWQGHGPRACQIDPLTRARPVRSSLGQCGLQPPR